MSSMNVIVAFNSDWESNPLGVVVDVDAAANGLRQAGYEVFRLPDEDGRRLAVDSIEGYLEVHLEGPNEPLFNEIDAIVGKHGGLCVVSIPAEPGHVPFADLAKVQLRMAPEAQAFFAKGRYN